MVSLVEGTVISGKYRLERALARGGMGSVWVARHLQLETDVAIKFMGAEYASSPDARVRFEREARASAQLRSPHVVHMYDYGAEEGTLFLVMELLQGEDLAARLQRSGRLAPAMLSSLVDQVCKALECAHDAGLVHRDLKPANIFLARQGRDEVVKVLDFGIAKAIGPTQATSTTKTGTLLGSPHYMSPEQVRRSKEIDARSDLWSLGVIIFQCLTGRLLFPGDELGDVLVAICSDEIPCASQLVPELGPEVDRFLARALMRSPAQRFQSARELAEAFAEVAHGAGQPFGAYGRSSATSVPALGASPSFPPAASGAFMPHPGGGAGAGVSTPPLAAASTLPPGAAPGWGAASPSVNTLAPAGATFSVAPRPTRWIAAIAAMAGVATVLGLVVVVFLLRTQSSGAAAGSGGEPAAQAPALAPSADLALSVPSPEGSAKVAPAVSAAAAVPAPSASVAASAGIGGPVVPRPAFTSPSGKAPVPGKLVKKRHDPLEHL